jgi:serine protease Do
MRLGKRVLFCGFVLVAALLLIDSQNPQAAYGQQKGKGAPFSKDDPKFRALFTSAVTTAAKSTVRIQCDAKDTALGVVVAEDGFILTKASDLTGKISVKTHEGIILPAHVVGRHEAHDLAMLKVEASGFVPVQWSESKIAGVGHFVASAGTGTAPVAIGVVSVPARDVPPSKSTPKAPPTGPTLGVKVLSGTRGAMIVEVLPNSVAERAKLKVDDFILGVGDKTVKDLDDLMDILSKVKLGDTLALKILRGTEELKVDADFGGGFGKGKGKGGKQQDQNTMGSRLSNRRTGFPNILQHDSVVLPEDCGGPLVDLDGHVIGINIARAGRVESWAIPAETIKPLLADLMSGKLAPKK